MKMKSMITGVSMAIAAGTVAYAVTEATSSEKKMLKSRTGRAIRAILGLLIRRYDLYKGIYRNRLFVYAFCIGGSAYSDICLCT